MDKKNLSWVLLILLVLLLIFIGLIVIFFLWGHSGTVTNHKNSTSTVVVGSDNSDYIIKTPVTNIATTTTTNSVSDQYTNCLINPNLDYCVLIAGNHDTGCKKASDCGDDYDSAKYCKDGDTYIDHYEYSCESKKCVKDKTTEKQDECPNGCTNGKCDTDDSCTSNSDCTSNQFCQFNEGTCHSPGTCVTKTQTCSADYEPVCGCNGITYSNECLRQMAKISKLHDGVCNGIICNNDTQCDDNNSHTYDKCLNPGTTNSSCSHTNIICLSNSECGTDRYTGSPFCHTGNVFESFITYTCHNPGTTNSSCTDSTTDKLKQACSSGQTCSNGQCIDDNECDNDDDCGVDGFVGDKFCEDGDVHQNFKVNTCENPGCSASSCSSDIVDKVVNYCDESETCSNGNCIPKIIKCSKNCDCGTDSFVGDPFCTGNDVFQNFIIYKCLNPGTTDSKCSNSTAGKLKQNCPTGQTCSNGQCGTITCSNDSQCDDNNAHTLDKCDKPGTTSSSCSHTPIACLNNLECGTNGAVGGLFCSGKSVFQNFITFTCNNAGTTSSSCTSSTVAQLNQNCGTLQICQNGACVCNTKNGKTLTLSDPFVIRDFVNKKAAALHLRTTTDAYNLDSVTAKKICNLAGYYNVKSTGCVASNYQDRCGWYSCGDNVLSKWNPKTNNFVIANACDMGNTWISSITCVNKMC